MPEILIACLTITASNQPHLLLRPVTVPNSCPNSPSLFPISFFCSVGNGPDPTLVVYAFVIPNTLLIFNNPKPDPLAALPETVEEDVTNGYVP